MEGRVLHAARREAQPRLDRARDDARAWRLRRPARARGGELRQHRLPDARPTRPSIADRLDAQLDDLMRRFMSDRSRNRYDARDADAASCRRSSTGTAEDFEHGPPRLRRRAGRQRRNSPMRWPTPRPIAPGCAPARCRVRLPRLRLAAERHRKIGAAPAAQSPGAR
ncbi:MAG: hypothetical protein MZW92_06150 [Comamonadaceae bacterium]|nr:hypothetical protein [Comamonadaceae bacterium]